MKIIEGTPEEIKKYLEKKEEPVIETFHTRNVKGFNQFVWRDQTKKHGKHWSNNKMQWVNVEDMNSKYILNVLRQKLKESNNDELLLDDEFQSLVINLGDKIVEGE